MPDYGSAISSIETGGASDPYTTMGPATQSGDRAHGKYQIMGINIGPWSKEVLGREVTPQEFLDPITGPAIQDAIFNAKFGGYVDKYGPEGAAKAWFAGEKGMNNPNAKDSLGTTVSGYGAKFMKALGQPMPPQMTADSGQPSPVASQLPASAIPAQPMPSYGYGAQNAPAATPAAQTQMAAQPEMTQPPQMQPIGAPRRPPNIALLQAFLQQHAPASPGLRFIRG